jgi:lipopolysaccharide transport system permease protein
VYFPRLYLVLSPVIAGLVDLVLASFVLVGLMIYYAVTPQALGLVYLIPLLLLAFVTTVGMGAWLAALNVKYRDVRFVVPFLLQTLMFATPVVYSISALTQPWRTLFGLNPMTTVIEGFRWALAGAAAPSPATIGLSVASAALLSISGLFYFHQTEKIFADVI